MATMWLLLSLFVCFHLECLSIVLASADTGHDGVSSSSRTSAGPRIRCSPSNKRCYSYSLVSATGEQVLLQSPDVPIAVCNGGKWKTESNGGLVIIDSSSSAIASTFETHSRYTKTFGHASTWIVFAYNVTSTGQRIVLHVRSFPESNAIIFTTTFPDGLDDASGCSNAITDPDGELGGIVSGWPAFRYPDTTYNYPLHSTLSWGGSFLRPMPGDHSTGGRGGPTVFIGQDHVVIGSPIDAYGSWTAGAGSSHDGAIRDIWNPGVRLSIKSIPKGWSSSTILTVFSQIGGTGSSPSGSVSITGAIHAWGSLLRKYHNSISAYEMSDITLQKIGMQTDNGAYYCFCRTDCSNVLLRKVKEFKVLGVPMGYVSFQGSGASLGRGSGAPWCVSRWGPDDGLGANYPMTLADFQSELDLPLQLYAPYFCETNDYLGLDNTSQWRGVRSNTSLPGCGSYDFWDIAPELSKQFYDWFFAKGKTVGMVSFEPDFMNQNRNCVPVFRKTVQGADLWQRGMADAAKDAGLTVQWCYATPIDLLASLDFDSVTNFRVSGDFCYGNSWDIGLSSLLPSALGKAPSKDTLWSSSNNRTAIPGCSWTPDHEDTGAALHVALALLSTGPVGISDGVGFTNATMLKYIIRSDGTLLKPSRPVTLIDSLIRDRCHKNMRTANASGEVYISHSSSQTDFIPTCVRAWYVISFKVKADFLFDWSDLYPSPCSSINSMSGNKSNKGLLWRTFDGGYGCRNGESAIESGCLKNGPILIPASDFSNTTMGTDYGHVLTTLYSPCKSGWIFLGELDKLVPLSTNRFPTILCDTNAGITIEVTGSKGEIVDISLVDPDGILRREKIKIEGLATQRVTFRHDKPTLVTSSTT